MAPSHFQRQYRDKYAVSQVHETIARHPQFSSAHGRTDPLSVLMAARTFRLIGQFMAAASADDSGGADAAVPAAWENHFSAFQQKIPGPARQSDCAALSLRDITVRATT